MSGPLFLIRDGTIFGAGATEIDLRTPDYSVWITVKGDRDSDAESAVAELLRAFGVPEFEGSHPGSDADG